MFLRAIRNRVRGLHCGTQGNPTGTRKTPDYFGLAGTQNAKHVRSFLGLCCFYHQFFPQFATIASPLTALTGKRLWQWGAVEQRAFEDLKESFLRHVVLAFPDRNKPYILYTDASDSGVGAMLCQEDDEKRLRLVVCMSRKLNKHEVNYPVHEKELLALVESTTKWRHYLHGLPVIVYTDSSALKYL